MNTKTAFLKARLRQTRGSLKETWGNISHSNRTKMEGKLDKMAGRSQVGLLRTEARARKEIDQALEDAQQNIQKLSASLLATANQTLGKPAKQRSSWPWIPSLGGIALLAGLGLAVFTHKTGVFASQHTAEIGAADN
jgi:uncharacterized protein YjbJ (UPF0337 family)